MIKQNFVIDAMNFTRNVITTRGIKMSNKIYKSLIYRLWSAVITAIILYFLTYDVVITTTFTIIIEITKIFNYYVFEHMWCRWNENKNRNSR